MKKTISEMKNTVSENYGRFHTGKKKNTSEIECAVMRKIQNKA